MNKLSYEFLVIYLYALLCVFLPTLIAILIFFQYPILWALACLLLGWIGFATTIIFSCFTNIRYLKNTPSEFNIKNEYVGVVVTTTNLRVDRYMFIFLSDMLLLIEYLKRKNQSFKLLTKFDKQKFDDMIYDEKCRGLYILGHGRRHGLMISEDEMIYYCEYQDAPKKDFVVQMHCNHMKGKSLADYLCAKEEFPTDKMRMVKENLNYVQTKLKNELNVDTLSIYKSFLFKSLKMIKIQFL